MKKNIWVLACAGVYSTNAAAIEFMGSDWKGEGEFGYVSTSGNTDTTNLKARLGLVNERDMWRHSAMLEALNASDNDVTTAERYAATWQTDYKFAEFDYIFGRIHYETDKFSGYDYRISETIGYGRRVLHRDDMTLDLEAGPGARQSKLETGESENEMIFRLAGRYAWQITEQSRFTQDLAFDIGEDATITKSVTALQASIVGNLSMKLSYTVENVSDVPPGVKKTDTQTAATLVYSF
jgi:putative salt-induced outer membrane protein